MRGKATSGRFPMSFEMREISVGLEQDVQNPLEQWIDWWRYSSDTQIDPIYDVGDYGGGRVWEAPIRLLVMRQEVNQGPVYPNERGFYTNDDMTFIVNESEFRTKLPNVAYGPDPFLKDRIVWRGEVFHPTRINPRSHIHNTATTVVIEATQVKPDELVNDPQFNWVVTRHGGQWQSPTFEGTDVTETVNEPTPTDDEMWLYPDGYVPNT